MDLMQHMRGLHLEAATREVAALVALFRAHVARAGAARAPGYLSPTGHVEFELRFGTQQRTSPHRFESGVSEAMFARVLHDIAGFAWDREEPPRESQDFFYRDRQRNGVRTTTEFRVGEHGVPRMTRSHIAKKTLAQKTLCLGVLSPNGRPTSQVVFGQDLRVSVNAENAVSVNILPNMADTEHVRIKQRRSFHRGPFRFDFTIVWSGRTRHEAETNQRERGRTTFEIELEIADPARALAEHDDLRLAASVLLKMRDFVVPDVRVCTWTLSPYAPAPPAAPAPSQEPARSRKRVGVAATDPGMHA